MTTVTFNITVQNAFGLYATSTAEFDVVTPGPPPTLPPIIDSIAVSPTSGPPGTLLTVTINAHDQNDPPLALSYYARVAGPGFDLTPTENPNVFTYQV